MSEDKRMSRITFVMDHERGEFQGYRRLMSALLTNAVRDYLFPTGDPKHCVQWVNDPVNRLAQVEKDATDWLFGNCGSFTFEECCGVLGLSVVELRVQLRRMKRKVKGVVIPPYTDAFNTILALK